MKTRFITTLALAICISTSYSAQVKKKVTVKKSKVEAVNKDSVEHAALEEKAQKGDANAQNSLGIRYYTGKYVKQDFSKAITWWAAAAKQKHIEATANMGLCYQFGNGIKQDSIMAVKLYKTSIKMGNTKLVKEREEYVAKKFNMFDSNLLADIYSKGIGVTKDTQKALKYYLLSAKNGNVDACIAGAKIYENNQSYPEAYKLFNSAYDLYCLFWGLNMGMVESKDLKWLETNVEEMNKLSEKITAAMPELKNEAAASEVLAENDDSAFAKMKRMVRKAVNCCIE